MIKIPLYNQNGEIIGEVDLPKKVFGTLWKPALVHQVLVALQANRRKPIAHTKDRSEVRGGGRKPWRQKGTGRARHGSIRSPLWRGGGVTFGPRKERVFSKKINKKAKRIALFSALAKKLADQEIKVIDKIELERPKTKLAEKILEKFFPKKKNAGLVVLPQPQPELIRAVRNLKFAQVSLVNNLNVEEVLKYKYLLFLKDSLPLLEKIYKI